MVQVNSHNIFEIQQNTIHNLSEVVRNVCFALKTHENAAPGSQ